MAAGPDRHDDTPISVVMPVRDGSAFLREAIDSILAQTFGVFEFIIVDDGSTDATPAILREAAGGDTRIRLAQAGGAGIVAALNLGIAQASGDYVARMDADDIALPERLALQLAEMRARPSLLALGTAAIQIDAAGRESAALAVAVQPEEVRRALRRRNPLLHPTVMMRRDAVIGSGGYRNALTLAEDYDLWLRLSRRGDVANLATPLLKLRSHTGQISSVRRLDQRAATALARQIDAREKAGSPPGDMAVSLAEALRRHLSQTLAGTAPLALDDAADLAVMLRSAARAGLLPRAEVGALARRIVREGRLPSGWMLPIKLWLRR